MPERASLQQLHDLALPEAVGLWPPAPFLLGVAGLLMVLFLLLAWWYWRRWRREAYRRHALARLALIERRIATDPESLRDLAVLLKVTMLEAWPRQEVAALSGESWLAFLQEQAADCELPEALGKLSFWPPERLAELSPAARTQLIQAARQWLERHVRS